MQVPPTPIVVPPTPLSGGVKNGQDDDEAERRRQGDDGNDADKGVHRARGEPRAQATEETDAQGVVIAESPEDDDRMDAWPDIGSASRTEAQSTSPSGKPRGSNGKKHAGWEKKGCIPTGRSRSRSGSSSSQCRSCSISS